LLWLLGVRGKPKSPPSCRSNLSSKGICALLRSSHFSCNWLRWDSELNRWGEMCVEEMLLEVCVKFCLIVIFGICGRHSMDGKLFWSVLGSREQQKWIDLIFDIISVSRLWINLLIFLSFYLYSNSFMVEKVTIVHFLPNEEGVFDKRR